MAGKNIGPTIGLGGEAEFRKQIKNINAELGVLQAQLDKSAASFAGNEKSEEALADKSRLLAEMNEKLGKAAEATRKQYDAVSSEYGENSNAALKLEKDLLKLEKQIIKNNNAIEENSKALEDNGNDLEENTEKVSFWAQNVQNKFNAAKDMVNNVCNVMKQAFSAANDMVSGSAENASEIVLSAEKAGITTQKYQELQYAAQMLKIDVGTLTDSMRDLSEKAFDAMKDPAGETAQLFNTLNVSVTDWSGKLKDSQTIWEETLVALGNMSNETERNATALKLLGGASSDLSAVMGTQGILTLQSYATEAHNVGAVMNNQTIASLQKLNETQIQTQQTIEGVKERLSAQLAPEFANVAQAAANLVVAFEPLITEALGWALNHVPEITAGFGMLTASLIALKLVSTLTPLINLMNTSLMQTNATVMMTNATMLSNPVVIIVTGVVAALGGLVAGIALFNSKSDEINQGLNNMNETMEETANVTENLEKNMEQVANSIDWDSINLDFEAKFAILGANSAAAFKKNLLEGFDGFEDELSQKLSGMKVSFSGGGSGAYTPVVQGTSAPYQEIDITMMIDKQKLAEILFDPLRGVAKQKGLVTT